MAAKAPLIGWLRLAGSLELQLSFAEYHLFYRALFQKRPVILRSLLIVARLLTRALVVFLCVIRIYIHLFVHLFMYYTGTKNICIQMHYTHRFLPASHAQEQGDINIWKDKYDILM